MNEVIKSKVWFDRNADSIPCPKCNGYADSVDLTQEEIKNVSCGSCCGRAFLCRLCSTRIIGEAHAPEMEECNDGNDGD